MTLEEKIETLELAVRRLQHRSLWKVIVLGLAIVALIWGIESYLNLQTSGYCEIDNLSVHHLAVKDAAGQLRMDFRVDETTGTSICLLDSNGNLSAILSVDVAGSGLSLFDKAGKLAALISEHDGAACYVFSDGHGGVVNGPR